MFHRAAWIPLPRLSKLLPLMSPNLHICKVTSIFCLPQYQLLPSPHLSSSCRSAENSLSPRLVHASSIFYGPLHRHSLAKRTAPHGHKSSSDTLQVFHPMGCNPNDTRMIVSYHMGACVFSHSRSGQDMERASF